MLTRSSIRRTLEAARADEEIIARVRACTRGSTVATWPSSHLGYLSPIHGEETDPSRVTEVAAE